MRDVLIFLAGLALGCLAGATGAMAAVELRHHCFPHNPETCRDTTGETR